MKYPIIPCTQQCGLEYCSIECRDKDWKSHHRLLCAKYSIYSELSLSLLSQFYCHAGQTETETYPMAAQVICSILLSAPIFSNGDLSFEDATSQAMEPYSSFEKKMWWEVADLSQQKDYDFEKYEGKLNSDKDSKILRNELEESLNILT